MSTRTSLHVTTKMRGGLYYPSPHYIAQKLPKKVISSMLENISKKPLHEASIYTVSADWIQSLASSIANELSATFNAVGKFEIVYIVWGTFTETVPRNLPPQKRFPLDIKKKFDTFLDSTLGTEFSLKHRNLNAIGLGWKISKGFYTDTPAIIFYVIRKGVIPIGSEILPRDIYGIKTDVREGFYDPC